MRRPVGVKGIGFGICWSRCFFPAELPLSPPFHPHSSLSALLRSVQVGCSHFSRCCHLFIDLSSISRWKWARRLTQSPELGFRLWLFLSQRVFGFRQPPASLWACYGATVRTLLRSPTGDAARRPAFAPPQ